jgi:hypothetical protein
MSASIKDSVRNTFLSDVISAIGTTGVLCLFSGAATGKSAGTFAADPTGLLVEVALPSSPFGAVSAGAAALAGTWTGTASAGSSTAPASYRIKTTTGGGTSTVIAEGSAGVGSGDVNLPTAITSGQVVNITSFTLTAGNA